MTGDKAELAQGLVKTANDARANLVRTVSKIPVWHTRGDDARSDGYVGRLLPNVSTYGLAMSAMAEYVRAEAMLALAVRLHLASLSVEGES